MKCIMQPLYNFLKMWNLCIAITINLFLPMSRWCLEVVGITKQSSLVSMSIFGKCQKFRWKKMSKMKCIMQPLYNFLKMWNLCIAITINLFLPMSRWCLEVVGISKHLVWCCIFGKCQNLGGSDEMYYAATIQFSKNVEFVHCNYHKFIFANE